MSLGEAVRGPTQWGGGRDVEEEEAAFLDALVAKFGEDAVGVRRPWDEWGDGDISDGNVSWRLPPIPKTGTMQSLAAGDGA